MRSTVEGQLSSKLEPKLVKELLDAHAEAKRNFYLGGLRLSAVEGGRFCEAAFRLLQDVTEGKHTPLSKSLPKTDALILQLSNLDASKFNDSIRLHIPRSLRLVYDIRNKRDTAHLTDGIDPNLQDATLVVTVIDWVLAEFIRLYHNVTANEASKIVNGIVKRVAPVVQDFNGFLKILNPKLGVSDHCAVLLYQRGDDGATYDELEGWARPKMRRNLQRALDTLVDDKDFAHFDGMRYFITRHGEQYVELKSLISPAQLT
ncbi:hypothetical protein GCM10011487_53750 [Steroidobacter agaridevorans]|uniref:Uncharacterized protein n=1 Tax=Steroidobacter agaridevorans TaxID=2695856 RepID=A0A829YJB6_9GAMM|nr:hypothetical protein [Steroidobacter agaridevorans]GFE83375.1 hypothetical protein GCM10011487_53750 [Steroidobacter agaridevorans]